MSPKGQEPDLDEINFDGLPGPTHNHSGLSPGNLASVQHAGGTSNPREAALDSLAKMRTVWQLGVTQAVLPPHERPLASALARLGLGSSTGALSLRQADERDHLLRLCSSSSAMWTANAATVAPAPDTVDGRLHVTVANLSAMFHRSLEASTTQKVMQAVFADPHLFAVHAPLPAGPAFADEGAANHTRLCTPQAVVHLFGWGRRHWGQFEGPQTHPARQTEEASRCVSRLNALPEHRTLLWQQTPAGIDSGAFHSDVLAVGSDNFLLFHELAFVDPERLVSTLSQRLGKGFKYRLVRNDELTAAQAVATYPFNSQLLTAADGSMIVVAPAESQQAPETRRLLERLVEEDNPISKIHFLNVTGSMRNGGGPACLRLRVPVTAEQRRAIRPRVLIDDALLNALEQWVARHYRDRLEPSDLADPQLSVEMRVALDELTQLLKLGNIYDFQQ